MVDGGIVVEPDEGCQDGLVGVGTIVCRSSVPGDPIVGVLNGVEDGEGIPDEL